MLTDVRRGWMPGLMILMLSLLAPQPFSWSAENPQGEDEAAAGTVSLKPLRPSDSGVAQQTLPLAGLGGALQGALQ